MKKKEKATRQDLKAKYKEYSNAINTGQIDPFLEKELARIVLELEKGG